MPVSSKPSVLAQRIASLPERHDNHCPLWQGPCAQGPLGGITQSMLSRFMSCRERFRLRYLLGLEPHDKWNHRLGYGQMWHKCEESLANGGEVWDTRLLEYSQKQLDKYPLQREEITKWYNVCCVQFPEYVNYWSNHPDVRNRTPLLQEQVFDVPYRLPSSRVVRLRGRWDSVDLIDGGIYLQENKTKGDIDRSQIERQLRFDLQTMMYLVALQNVDLESIGLSELTLPIPPKFGVRYNVVRRPLSGGKGNIVRHKATKSKPAETEEEFYERLRRDYLSAEPDYWFFRVRAEISERDMRTFQDTCLDPLLEQLCWWYDDVTGRGTEIVFHGFPPLHYRTPFGVYSALEEGGSTEYDAVLETGSEVGLRRTEELFTELKD